MPINLNNPIFWLLLSGITFLIMAIIFLTGPFRRERNELMIGILGFLGGMASFHILLGLGMLVKIPLLNTLAAFGAMSGSAFLLKFPLTAFANQKLRKRFFNAALAIAWLIIVLLLTIPHKPDTPMIVASLYMIVNSGLIGGTYLIWKGLSFKHPAYKIKCIGAGCSVFFCCFLTHIIVLTIGMTVLAKLFMVLTPVTVVLSIVFGHAIEKKYPGAPIAPTAISPAK